MAKLNQNNNIHTFLPIYEFHLGDQVERLSSLQRLLQKLKYVCSILVVLVSICMFFNPERTVKERWIIVFVNADLILIFGGILLLIIVILLYLCYEKCSRTFKRRRRNENVTNFFNSIQKQTYE